MDENKQIAQKIISQASNWNFEGDCMILQLMQSIQKNLETRANNTVYSLDNLKTNINRAQIDLENTQNSLLALQYSQYVEMRCQEEAAFEVENVTTEQQHQTQQQPTSQQEILENFLENNIKMLHNCHDKFNFMEESDEDDNTATTVENCIYQPRNPYNERLLPHIYGTKMWKEQSHVGLEDDDSLADYSGDEKAEVYSVSSTSSEGRESPESNLMTNTSQHTSNTSLSNEFNTANKIPKNLSSISNTPSVSSLTLDSSLRKYPSENLPNIATTTQAASSLKKLTLNLFDDNDYKNLVSEIAQKTQSVEYTEKSTPPIQVENAKIDLFANEDPLPIITSKIPTQNSQQKQNVTNANLVRDSTEVSYDFFQDTSKPAPPKATTKLSARNLFDDDNDDEDFLNIFAKKTESTPVTKHTYPQSNYSRKPLAHQGAHSINRATKSLFFDDDDDDDMDNDFFARKPVQSNIQKSLEQPKNYTFPAYLSTEPPLDINPQQTGFADQKQTAAVEDEEIFDQKTLTQQLDDSQKAPKAATRNKPSFGIDFDADKDDDLFGNKQVKITTSSGKAINIFADNKDTKNFDEKTAYREPNKAKELINEGESSKTLTSVQEEVKHSNVDVVAPKNATSVEDFEKVLGLEKKKQDFEQTEVKNSKELANKLKSLERINVENPQTQTVVKVAPGTLAESKPESTVFNTTDKAVDNKNETSIIVSENQPNLKKTDSASERTSFNPSAWLTEPPLDEELPESTAFEDETVDEDDFLSIFHKKKQTMPQVNDNNEKQEAVTDKKTAPHIEESISESNEADINDKIASKQTETCNESKNMFDVTAESMSTARQRKSSAFDHFSPLFLDEPPDDDDFLQAVSSSSKHNIGPVTQFGAEHDFYESTKQNSQKTDIKPEENLPAPAAHANYSIRLFDELPPDDNEQANVADTKPNTLKNLFASDAEIFSTESTAQKFDQQTKCVTENPVDIEGDFLAKSKPQLLDNSHESEENRNHKHSISAEQKISSGLAAEGDILITKILTPIPQQLDQQAKSVAVIVQAIEKPTIKQETIKSPIQNISKSNLPKININVQALLPNAAGPKSLKRNLGAAEQVDEVDRVQTLLPNAAGQISLKRNLEADKQQVDEVDRENKTVHAAKKTSPGNLQLLPNLNKTRVRVPVKRKTSTRAARQEGYRRTLQAEDNANAYEDLGVKDKVRSTNSQRTESIAKKIESSTLEKPSMQPSMPSSHQLTKDSKQISVETLPKTSIPASNLFSKSDDEEDEFFKDLSGNKTIKATEPQLKENIYEKISCSPLEKPSMQPSMPTSHQLTKESKQTPTETTKVLTAAGGLFSDNDDADDDFFEDLVGKKTHKPTKPQQSEKAKEITHSSLQKTLVQPSETVPQQPLVKASTQTAATQVTVVPSALLDFFDQLAQPKLPTTAANVKKTAVNISEIPKEDSDEDLFASNIAKVGKPTLQQSYKPASDQALILKKPVSVTTKSIPKKKALFDSDSSSENENVDNLFKASKPLKPTFQATPKAPTAVHTVKSISNQNMQSKNTSLFSDSEDDDGDNLFGSSSSKLKNSRSLTTVTKNSSLTKQQQKKDTVPSGNATDNPLADLLE